MGFCQGDLDASRGEFILPNYFPLKRTPSKFCYQTKHPAERIELSMPTHGQLHWLLTVVCRYSSYGNGPSKICIFKILTSSKYSSKIKRSCRLFAIGDPSCSRHRRWR